jgi:hypothetical protein
MEMSDQSQGARFVFAKLNSIERFHYFDSSDRFPNRITCRLLVNQSIDLLPARQACYWLGERHPVLKCSIEKQWGKLVWLADPDRYGRLDQQGLPRPVPRPLAGENSQSGDPSSQTGVETKRPGQGEWERGEERPWFFAEALEGSPAAFPDFPEYYQRAGSFTPFILIRQWDQAPGSADSAKAEIWLSIHHTYCDGGGGVAIINDWIQIYENLLSGRSPTEGLPAIDPARFSQRNQLGLLSWKFLKNLPFQCVGLFGASKFIFRSNATLEGLSPDSNSDDAIPHSSQAIASCWLSETDWQALEKDAQQQDYNLNARFVAELFVALHKWRSALIPKADSRQWLRIILPINIRSIGDRRLSAANRSSIVQIDRRRLRSSVDRALVRSIQREVGVIIQWKLDRMFLIFMKVIGLSSHLLKNAAQNKKHRGLAVFTNLGQPFRRLDKRDARTHPGSSRDSGEECRLQPLEIDFLAPLRHGTSLNFTVARFGNRLRVTLHYDPQVIPADQAIELSEAFRDQLQAELSS